MEQKCLECGERIQGRADKKFCSDHCRNHYHNKFNRDSTNYVRKVNRILRNNRRILKELNPNGKITVHRDKLVSRGFQFNFHTNTYTTKSGKTYHFCYDQGYLPLDNDMYALVEREEYIH